MITSACPSCGVVAEREPYDIGSGPELACASCDWCWGAEGQDLKPLDHETILAEIRRMEGRRGVKHRDPNYGNISALWAFGTVAAIALLALLLMLLVE